MRLNTATGAAAFPPLPRPFSREGRREQTPDRETRLKHPSPFEGEGKGRGAFAARRKQIGHRLASLALLLATLPAAAMEMTVFGADGSVRQTLPLPAPQPEPPPAQAIAAAGQPAAIGAAPAPAGRMRHELSLLYRNDNLDWRIAPADEQPDILSELNWRDIQLAGLSWRAQWPLAPHWSLETLLAGAGEVGGSVRDSDYVYSDRQAEFSRSVAGVDHSHVADAALGLRLQLSESRLAMPGLALTGGVVWHEQNLRASRARQEVSRADVCPPSLCGSFSPPPEGYSFDAGSQYRADWRGGYLGAQLEFWLQPALSLRLDYQYQRLKYHAEANWALRSEFAHPLSFSHDAWGHNHQGQLALNFFASDGSGWQLALFGSQARTGSGNADVRWANSGDVAQGSGLRLQGVDWRSAGMSLGYSSTF